MQHTYCTEGRNLARHLSISDADLGIFTRRVIRNTPPDTRPNARQQARLDTLKAERDDHSRRLRAHLDRCEECR